jgi:hypothetical protein
MRITSGGDVAISTTSNPVGASSGVGGWYYSTGSYQVVATLDGVCMYLNRISTDGSILVFRKDGTSVGSVSVTGSATAYNTSSDYRLKQDLKDFNGLDLLTKIKTYDYEWKADKSRGYGVIAHELQSVINYAVTGVKDGKEMQGVDYSKIVPVLIKAIQEQQQQIEQLKNK